MQGQMARRAPPTVSTTTTHPPGDREAAPRPRLKSAFAPGLDRDQHGASGTRKHFPLETWGLL